MDNQRDEESDFAPFLRSGWQLSRILGEMIDKEAAQNSTP